MKLDVTFSATARRQLLSAVEYLAEESPHAASALVDRVESGVNLIGEYPEIGRILPESPHRPYREIQVPPYRLVYRIHQERVVVMGFWHSAQLPHDPDSG